MMVQEDWLAVGQMSGTSLDGVDLCAARFVCTDGHWQYQLLATLTEPYPAHWQQRLAGVHTAGAADLAKLHVDYGHYLGMLIRRFLLLNNLEPDLVALHGHTAFHQPWQHFTAQLGCGETVASYLQVPVVSNFRVRDVALGGQGAPLVPLGEWALFPQAGLFLNLGGIANISLLRERLPTGNFTETTWLKPGWQYLAYDVTACNLILNRLAGELSPPQGYDKDGAAAASGNLNSSLATALQQLPYYHNVPPRSLGQEEIDAAFWPVIAASTASPADKLHTWCHHLASQLARELKDLGVRDTGIVITGGGAHNSFLIKQLDAQLAPLGIQRLPILPKVVDYKEALIFGFLGLMRLQGQPTVLPGTTGSRVAASGGSLHLPAGWKVARA